MYSLLLFYHHWEADMKYDTVLFLSPTGDHYRISKILLTSKTQSAVCTYGQKCCWLEEKYIPCCVRACSRGDTTLEGGFSRMTLLVTENANFTVLISSWPWPWPSAPSLGCQMETKVDSDNMTSFATHVLSWMRFQQSQSSTALEAPVQTRREEVHSAPFAVCQSTQQPVGYTEATS